MANQFNTMPFTLTAAMGSSYRNTVAAGQQTNVLNVPRIEFVGATGAGSLVIQDGHGNLLAQITPQAGDDFITLTPAARWFDFQVTTLTGGGTLLIYLQ